MPKARLQDRPDTQGSILDISLSEISCIHPVNANCTVASTVLLQHCADPNIRNTDGKTALDLADPSAKAVLTGKYWCNAVLFCLKNDHDYGYSLHINFL